MNQKVFKQKFEAAMATLEKRKHHRAVDSRNCFARRLSDYSKNIRFSREREQRRPRVKVAAGSATINTGERLLGICAQTAIAWLCLFLVAGCARAQCPGGQCPMPAQPWLQPLQPQQPNQPNWRPQTNSPAESEQANEGPDRGARPNVVRIGNSVRGSICKGTGTVIDDGVLTCAHLFMDGVGSIAVRVPSTGEIIDAQLIQQDPANDLALLAIPNAGMPAATIADRDPRIGDIVTGAGYGGNRVYRDFTGRVVRFGASWGQKTLSTLEFSGTARQGDSGGPVFDRDGKLVAVLSFTGEGNTGGISATCIRQFLSKIRGRGVNRPPVAKPRLQPPIDNETEDPPLAPVENSKADRIAELEKQLEAERSKAPPVPQAPDTSLLDKLKADLARANQRAVEAEHKPPVTIEMPGPERIVEKVMGIAEKKIDGFIIPKAVAIGGPAAGVAAWVILKLIKRAGKKRMQKRMQDLAAKAQQVVPGLNQPSPTNSGTAEKPASEPTAVTEYSLSTVYANNLAQKRAHEGASIPQEALMGQLYKEHLGKLRKGSLAEASFAKQVEEAVREQFLNRHGVRTSY